LYKKYFKILLVFIFISIINLFIITLVFFVYHMCHIRKAIIVILDATCMSYLMRQTKSLGVEEVDSGELSRQGASREKGSVGSLRSVGAALSLAVRLLDLMYF
jgi:hypothetical protein